MMPNERAEWLTRRGFCTESLGLLAVTTFANCLYADDEASNSASRKSPKPNLVINQATFGAKIDSVESLTEVVRLCRDVWGLSGFELSLAELAKIGNNSLEDTLEKLKVSLDSISLPKGCGEFKLALSVDSTNMAHQMEAAIRVARELQVAWCSFEVSDFHNESGVVGQLNAWVSNIGMEKCENFPRIMLETPFLTNGMEVVRLSRVLELVSPEVGVLLRSSTTRYRFDIALEDLTNSLLRDEDSVNSKRRISARITIDVNPNQSQRQIAFNREMYHRATVGQLSERDKLPLDFISLKSNTPITWKDDNSLSGAAVIDNSIFTDVLTDAKNDLSNA